MKSETSIRTVEVEKNKRYSILARAINLALKEVGIDCHVDLKSDAERITINVENK